MEDAVHPYLGESHAGEQLRVGHPADPTSQVGAPCRLQEDEASHVGLTRIPFVAGTFELRLRHKGSWRLLGQQLLPSLGKLPTIVILCS